jgi:hypothetical protein
LNSWLRARRQYTSRLVRWKVFHVKPYFSYFT